MRIKRLEIENFRALRSTVIDFSPSTALIGENNSGKSAFLVALDLFFSRSPKVRDKDFADDNTKAPIDITLHFDVLTDAELTEFKSNLLDGSLVVTRRLLHNNPSDSGSYFVSARVNPDFASCRNQSGKTEKRTAYAELRQKYGEDQLPKESKADDIDTYLEAWEAANPDKLKVERVGSFKGWTNVAAGKLKEKTDYIFVRAVQDASDDAHQGKNSPVRQLINAIARQTIENNEEFREFMANANRQIQEFTDPKNVPALNEISGHLTSILRNYYLESELIATWKPIDSIQPSFPTSEIAVKDKGYITDIDGVGHGLQRAVILTVLRYMSERRIRADGKTFEKPQSDIIIGIEEPEAYQHPIKQRLFSRVLRTLAEAFNIESGIRIQIIFVTHSPLLISLSECEQIRLIRYNPTSKKNVEVSFTTLESCASEAAAMYGIPTKNAWSTSQMAAKLHTFRGEIAEGFFGRCVVLVEGVGDKAVLEAYYQLQRRDPHSEGIVIVDVGGKNNLGRPVIVFKKFGIPCYWIFDNDRAKTGAQPQTEIANSVKENRALQLMAGVSADKAEDYPKCVMPRFAALDEKMEKYVSDAAGEQFSALAESAAAAFDIVQKDCLKFPASAGRLIQTCTVQGVKFPMLEEIVAAIDALK